MNKKALSLVMSTIVVVAISLLVLTALAYTTTKFTKSTECASNVEMVKAWVLLQSEKVMPSLSTARPPIIPLCDSLKITSLKTPQLEEKAKKQVADGLVDCWNAFARGDSDFISRFDQDRFCYACQAIEFSDSVQSSGKKLENFQRYLKETQLNLFTPQTYADYLSNKNPELFSQLPANDYLPTDKQLYIFFVAGKKEFVSRLATSLAAGLISGSAFIPVVGVAVGVGSAGLSLATYDNNFNPMLVIGDPERINSLCNEEFPDYGKQLKLAENEKKS